MIKKILFILVALLLVSSCQSNDDAQVDVQTGNGESMDEVETAGNSIEETKTGEVDKTFVLTGENYKFMMDGEQAPELVVNEGDRVRIEFRSTQGFHDWVVDEFNAATERVRQGGSTSVEFVADEKGTFEYYCSVGNHRQLGMVGNLVVE